MLDHCIYPHLDHILPSSDSTEHGKFRLEYISACKIIENKNYTVKIIPYLPNCMFELLLKSVIKKCYLEFITIDDINLENLAALQNVDISFPESLMILILNWPNENLILKNYLAIKPPFERFPSRESQLKSQKQVISDDS